MEPKIPHDPGISDEEDTFLDLALNKSLTSELSRTPPDIELITTLEGAIGANEPRPVFDDDKFATLLANIKFYKTLPSSSYSSLVPYQIPQVYEILRTCFPEPIRHIVDATAHIGGDSILFAAIFGGACIVSLDCDPSAIECLTHNINHFSESKRFEVVHANSVEWIRHQGCARETLLSPPLADAADFYYFDPPWGGPKYYTKKEISLTLDSVPMADIINMVFNFGLAKKVLLKVPRNFAYPSFKASVKGVCKLFYIKKPQKNGSIAYGLILITDEKGSPR